MSRTTWGRRIVALAVGCAAFLVIAEATLWILYFAFAPAAHTDLLAPRSGERRILCIGDSNTYGINLEPCASYPGRLQRYLDRCAGQPWHVINLGYPGQNTAQMRARLAENLAAYRPQIVIVWGGVNNTWSSAMRHLWQFPDSEPSPSASELLQKVRVYRAARMVVKTIRNLRSRTSTPDVGGGAVPGLNGVERGEGLGDVDIKPPSEAIQVSNDEVARTIALDLRRMLAICGEHGARLVVVDYPWEWSSIDDWIDPTIAQFARDHEVPLVPLRESIRPIVNKFGAARVEFAGQHATALLNREIARQVLRTLIDAGELERRDEWLSVPVFEAYCERVLFERVAGDARGADFEIQGDPHSRYEVRAEGLDAPLASGKLDGHGWALARVDLTASSADRRLWAEIRLPSKPNEPRHSDKLASGGAEQASTAQH